MIHLTTGVMHMNITRLVDMMTVSMTLQTSMTAMSYLSNDIDSIEGEDIEL